MAVMPRIDAFDEAVIDSPPLAVFKAILNEAAGVTHWWMPHWSQSSEGIYQSTVRVRFLT